MWKAFWPRKINQRGAREPTSSSRGDQVSAAFSALSAKTSASSPLENALREFGEMAHPCDVENERSRAAANSVNLRHGPQKNRGLLLASQLGCREHECSNPGVKDRLDFERSSPDVLVLGQQHPAALTDSW